MVERKNPIVVGLAWYAEGQWARLKELAADADKLEDSFDEWRLHATRLEADLKKKGVACERVCVDVDAMAAWCRGRGMRFDGEARADYVAEQLASAEDAPADTRVKKKRRRR